MNFFGWILTLLACLASSLPCLADSYDLVHIESEILDEQRQYNVLLPKHYAETSQHYPVIYRLDGAENIPLMKEVLNRLQEANAAPEVIIVAIENTDRLRDMYPTVNEDTNGPVGLGGGADKFLAFIEQELIPDVEKRYRTHSTRIIAGASAAGTFSVYAMQQRPGLFDAHIAYSPAVWWNTGAMVKRTEQWLATHPAKPTYLFMNMGNEGLPMRPYYDALLSAFTNNENHNIKLVVNEHPGVAHGLTATAGIFNAYQSFFMNKVFAREHVTADMQVIDSYYLQLGKQWGVDPTPPENVVRELGYYFSWQQHPDIAMQLFKHNLSHHPQNPDAITGVAYGYEAQNNLAQALNYAERALAAAPKDHPYYDYFVKNVARLRSQ
ncbi:alpha/beta hydrolase-fold protein [Aestuariibacter sp. A3R04]|uniref:alpha/beta hydrolase-fold protein n=1 Tax=Aestuariibacter sp. A3R04 TaxID=2841571 RepID=UPI001C092507|nr:alpha/beta hydrolase-fold protein [Aestuariibacter sp. A3R04]MBU3023629.1 esterase [Aestuariibacter sp. A3R04]